MAINNGALVARAAKSALSMIGRTQWPELFHSQTVDLNSPTTVLVPRTLNLTRPLESITTMLQFRVTVTVANYTAVAPEAPQNILQRLVLTGTHRAFGALTPINMTGATQFVFGQSMASRNGNDVIINGTRAADPGRPITSPFLGTTAGSPYDMTVIYHIPLTPQLGIGQAPKRDAATYLYFPQDWADSLQLQLQFGDESSFGNPTGATVAFTAFGSGAGLPTLQIHTTYSILGQLANQYRGGVVLRQENPLTTFTTAALQQRLMTLQKRVTSNVLVKSGVNQTAGITSGVQTFASLSDVQLDRTQIQVDNKPVRNVQSNLVAKSYAQRAFESVVPSGYYLLSFVDGQQNLLSYRGDELAGGSTYELVSDVSTASADNRQHVVQEMILGGPFIS